MIYTTANTAKAAFFLHRGARLVRLLRPNGAAKKQVRLELDIPPETTAADLEIAYLHSEFASVLAIKDRLVKGILEGE